MGSGASEDKRSDCSRWPFPASTCYQTTIDTMAESSNLAALAALEAALNKMILDGEVLAAFERFYTDDVIMQENSDPPVVGKAANRQREEAMLGNLTHFGAELLGSAVADGVTYSEWIYTITSRDGRRQRLCEVSARRWRGDRVFHERFYYERS